MACPSADCANDAVLWSLNGKSGAVCPRCGATFVPILASRRLSQDVRPAIEDELAGQASCVEWLDVAAVDTLPGPVALEYTRLKDLMLGGRIEAACWKLFNLFEVGVAYLFAAAVETDNRILKTDKGFHTIGKKVHLIRCTFGSVPGLGAFMGLAEQVVNWRNTLGVGHGSLSLNRQPYVDSLLAFAGELSTALDGFLKATHQLSIVLRTSGGVILNGPGYGILLRKNDDVLCTSTGPKTIRPLRLFAYHFEPRDVYFLDSADTQGIYRYRNFAQNRNKMIGPDGGIAWAEDPTQVAWLDDQERHAWAKEVGQKAFGHQSASILVKAAEQFVLRGMRKEAEWCIARHRSWSKDPKTLDENVRLLLLEFRLAVAAGNYKEADDYYCKVRSIFSRPIKSMETMAEIRRLKCAASRARAWQLYAQGQTEEALAALSQCRRLIAEELETRPFSARLQELEVRKDALYFKRRFLKALTVEDIEECGIILHLACRLYENDPFNYRVVDVMSWVINLSWEFKQRLGMPFSVDDAEHALIFAEKVRKRAVKHDPNDVWFIRGYAWSLHVKARFIEQVKNDAEQARRILRDALRVRLEGEQRFSDDIGIKEDVIKNLLSLLRLTPETQRRSTEEAVALIARLEAIRVTQGMTPLVEEFFSRSRELGITPPR